MDGGEDLYLYDELVEINILGNSGFSGIEDYRYRLRRVIKVFRKFIYD